MGNRDFEEQSAVSVTVTSDALRSHEKALARTIEPVPFRPYGRPQAGRSA